MRTTEFNDVLNKLKNYCTYQERCQSEVYQKLFEFNLNEDEKGEILIELIQENFLNEERFTKLYIRSKFYQKNWGKYKIKYELKRKQIPEKLINSCMNEIDNQDYIETLRNLFDKKYNNLKDRLHLTKTNKTIAYLQTKGYEFEDILKIADEFKNTKK